jgi:hypothetical protein
MKNCCTEINRDGSGQLARYLKALDPAYVLIDCRSMEELLVFAKRYAAQIRFYDIPGSNFEESTESSKVSWREFFRRDMAVIAASIAVVDFAQIKKDYDEIRNSLELHPVPELFADLFKPILGIATRIDRWYSVAIPENPLRADLDLAINSTLREQLKNLFAYEKGLLSVDLNKSLKLDSPEIDKILWGINDISVIAPDSSIYRGSTKEEKILNAALFVDDIFHAFYGFLKQLVEKSDKYMSFALEQYPAHQPHMALFIAFLELFRLAQEQMNGLTERMLNYYYRDVLHLTEKPSLPDRVHLVFELAKDVTQYDLAEGTALKAGKDALGKEQIYRTEKDLVINQAKVKELKTIFIEQADSATPQQKIINAIYARPVANSKDGFGEKISDPTGKWPTFGKGTPKEEFLGSPCDMLSTTLDETIRKDQAKIGFAIASPQLVLEGGNRLITLEVKNANNNIGNEFPCGDITIWLSAEDGWLKIDNNWLDGDGIKKSFSDFIESVSHGNVFNDNIYLSGYYIDNTSVGTIHIYLPVAEKSIIPFDQKIHKGYSIITPYPVMLVMVGHEMEIPASTSNIFNSATINNASLSVRVGSINENSDISQRMPSHFDGLKNLILQNDDGLIEPNKVFDPFTAYPTEGKSLYIGSHEVFNKPVSELAVNIKHVIDAIDDVFDIDPRSGTSNELSSLYMINILEKKQWILLYSKGDYYSFSEGGLTKNILYEIQNNSQIYPIQRQPISYDKELNKRTNKGFLSIQCNYNIINPSVEKVKILSTASTLKSETVSNVFQLMPFFAQIFKIKEISISYWSKLESLDPEIDQFFHIYPFGVVETYLNPTSGDNNALFEKLDKEKDGLLVDARLRLFPQFSYVSPYVRENKDQQANSLPQNIEDGHNQYSGSIQEEGMLFIGVENLKPEQTLSLLFQFAEGSAEDEDNDPPPIHWSYLTNNEWRPLKGENLVSDETYGFQTTGIVKIDVPADATNHNTIITDGLYCFCASVTENSNRIPQLVNVVAQAIEAKFENQGNAPSHFDKALAAGSIGKLAVPVAEVSKVQQPFASFDGKHQEIGKEFYTRVSERLRHKGRAINSWDYEHLVLDRFPSIYKVKCIPHTDPNCRCRKINVDICCGPQVAPGHVLLVPIANLKNRNAVNPLQPKTSRRTLLAIEDYLKNRVSPFVHIHAKNPMYEQIIVSFKVQFYSGVDKGYHMKKLNDEIVRFLTPWAFDENADVKFGQKVYASAIINFIEERGYVDFITDFLMFVCRDECCPSDDQTDQPITDFVTALSKVSGCNDMEKLIDQASGGNDKGDTVAVPSTSRSILVSVPQHIIVPYEAPSPPSLCADRNTQRRVLEERSVKPEGAAPAPQPKAEDSVKSDTPIESRAQPFRKTAPKGKNK